MGRVRAWSGLALLLLTVPVGTLPVSQDDLASFRKAASLSLPTWSASFTQACQDRAQTLAETGILVHEDALGRSPGLQMVRLGHPLGEYGEVLGAGSDWASVWTAWLKSPGHRDVLLTPGWVSWGGASVTRGETTVWVLRFWKP